MLSRDQRTSLTESGPSFVPIVRSLAATTMLTDLTIACCVSASRRFSAEYTTRAAISAANPASITNITGRLITLSPRPRRAWPAAFQKVQAAFLLLHRCLATFELRWKLDAETGVEAHEGVRKKEHRTRQGEGSVAFDGSPESPWCG